MAFITYTETELSILCLRAKRKEAGQIVIEEIDMDWTTLMASIVSSATVAGLVSFILKRAIQNSLDLHYKKQVRAFDAALALKTDRAKFVTNKQMELYQTTLTLVYRIRNECRDLLEEARKGQPTMPIRRPWFEGGSVISPLLYDNRAMFHEQVFMPLHDLKSVLQLFDHTYATAYHEVTSPRPGKSAEEIERHLQDNLKRLEQYYEAIDNAYKDLTVFIQDFLGIDLPEQA